MTPLERKELDVLTKLFKDAMKRAEKRRDETAFFNARAALAALVMLKDRFAVVVKARSKFKLIAGGRRM